MLKFLGMMVTIIVFVIGFEAPHALAQQTSPQEWKTYINPEYKFTMQYPYSGDGKFASRDHGITILDNTSLDILDSSTPLLISITPKNDTKDIKPYVESSLRNDLAPDLTNVTVFESIHPVSYTNTSGYEYVTYDGKDSLHANIFLDNGKHIFGFSSFDQKYDYDMDELRKVINSIKFFD